MYRRLLLARKFVFIVPIFGQRWHNDPSLELLLPTFYRMSWVMCHSSPLLGRQMLLLFVIASLQFLYPCIVAVDGCCKRFLRPLLANDELIEVLLQDRRRNAWRSDIGCIAERALGGSSGVVDASVALVVEIGPGV
jgi:hypothetical protein